LFFILFRREMVAPFSLSSYRFSRSRPATDRPIIVLLGTTLGHSWRRHLLGGSFDFFSAASPSSLIIQVPVYVARGSCLTVTERWLGRSSRFPAEGLLHFLACAKGWYFFPLWDDLIVVFPRSTAYSRDDRENLPPLLVEGSRSSELRKPLSLPVRFPGSTIRRDFFSGLILLRFLVTPLVFLVSTRRVLTREA